MGLYRALLDGPWIVGIPPPVGAAAHGLPGSHGPAERSVDHEKVNLRLTSRRFSFLPDVAVALAFAPITATLNRTPLWLEPAIHGQDRATTSLDQAVNQARA